MSSKGNVHEVTQITEANLIDILNKTLKGRGKNPSAPNPNDPHIAFLADWIHLISQNYLARRGWLKEYMTDVQRFLEAVDILSEIIPRIRPSQVDELRHAKEFAEKYGISFALNDEIGDQTETSIGFAEKNLNVLDQLGAAINSTIARRIPMCPIENLEPDFGVDHSDRFQWRGLVLPLAEAFHRSLPDRTKEDGYRFVAELIPLIAGATPSIDNIKQLLKAPYPLKREKTIT